MDIYNMFHGIDEPYKKGLIKKLDENLQKQINLSLLAPHEIDSAVEDLIKFGKSLGVPSGFDATIHEDDPR